jgi:hypothetical protein
MLSPSGLCSVTPAHGLPTGPPSQFTGPPAWSQIAITPYIPSPFTAFPWALNQLSPLGSLLIQLKDSFCLGGSEPSERINCKANLLILAAC